jgi:hypothetical protein
VETKEGGEEFIQDRIQDRLRRRNRGKDAVEMN